MLCCKARRIQEAVEHERSVGENTGRSRVFFPSPWVLYRFLSALQQNRAQSRLLYLFYDKESNNFPTHSAKFSNQTIFSKRVKVASVVLNNATFEKKFKYLSHTRWPVIDVFVKFLRRVDGKHFDALCEWNLRFQIPGLVWSGGLIFVV